MKDMHVADKRALRESLCNAASGRCEYCDRLIGMKGTVDHWVPQALGGTHERDNLRWACFPCNNAKGDMPPEDWLRRMPERVPRGGLAYAMRVMLHKLIVTRRNKRERGES